MCNQRMGGYGCVLEILFSNGNIWTAYSISDEVRYFYMFIYWSYGITPYIYVRVHNIAKFYKYKQYILLRISHTSINISILYLVKSLYCYRNKCTKTKISSRHTALMIQELFWSGRLGTPSEKSKSNKELQHFRHNDSRYDQWSITSHYKI